MKNKMSKKILATLPLFFLMVALAGCDNTSGSTDSEGNVIVTMSLMNSTNENPGWLAMIDAANEVLEANGEKVRIEPEIIKTSSWDEYYTKITSNMLGRTGGTIGRIAESHIPMMIEKNQIQDLTAIVNGLKETGEYNNAAFEGVAKVDDKYYGLPVGPGGLPGEASIKAVIYPDDNDYLYFLANVFDVNANKTYYSKTYSEHQQKCLLYLGYEC